MVGYSRKHDYARRYENDSFTRPAPSSPVSGAQPNVSVTVTSTTYTITNEDVVLVDDDTAGAEVTVTLPAVAGRTKPLYLKKIGNTANVVADGSGSEEIDTGLTATLTSQYEAIILLPTTSGWHIT